MRCLAGDRQDASDEHGRIVAARASDTRAKDAANEKTDRGRHGHVVCPKVNRKARVMSISRARSWPLLESRAKRNCGATKDMLPVNTSKRTVENDEKNCHPQSGSPQVQARRLLSRHYYPEGGWGWVVTVVSTLVHLLGPGLQLSIPATLALPATVKFYHHPLHTAGECLNAVPFAIIHG